MRDVNQVVLQGVVADPPQPRNVDGEPVILFTLNTETLQRNPDGSVRPERTWHHVVARLPEPASIARGLNPGALVAVEGKLRTRNYVNRGGHRIWDTEVLAHSVRPLDRTDAEHVNRAVILGNVGRVDPVRRFHWGQVVNVSVPTRSGWSPHDDGQSEVTEWNRVSGFGELAGEIEESVAVGQRILVEGLVRNRTYTDRAGVKRRSTEIVADSVLTSAPRAEPGAAPSQGSDETPF